MKESICRNTMIDHPNGVCSLGEIQKDVQAWEAISGNDTFGFTAKTVQALINKIIELQISIIMLRQRVIEGNGIV